MNQRSLLRMMMKMSMIWKKKRRKQARSRKARTNLAVRMSAPHGQLFPPLGHLLLIWLKLHAVTVAGQSFLLYVLYGFSKLLTL